MGHFAPNRHFLQLCGEGPDIWCSLLQNPVKAGARVKCKKRSQWNDNSSRRIIRVFVLKRQMDSTAVLHRCMVPGAATWASRHEHVRDCKNGNPAYADPSNLASDENWRE